MAVAASPAELQQLLAQKERELAAMFESGRPMPAASVVAAVRSEIATLEAQLGGRPAPAPFTSAAPTGGPARGPPSFGGGPQPPRMPASANMSPGPVRSRTEQLADKAYDMVRDPCTFRAGAGSILLLVLVIIMLHGSGTTHILHALAPRVDFPGRHLPGSEA